MVNVTLKVREIGVSTSYGKAKITAEPVEVILYNIEAEEKTHYELDEEGHKVFTLEGLRYLLQSLSATLTFEEF